MNKTPKNSKPTSNAAARPQKSAGTPKGVVKPQNSKSTAPKRAVTAPVKTASIKPVAKEQAAVTVKPVKEKKVKVVRDSFTIPKIELLQIAEMKKRALMLGTEIKKSELIRAGLTALSGMNDATFRKSITSVATVKTGRPAKE